MSFKFSISYTIVLALLSASLVSCTKSGGKSRVSSGPKSAIAPPRPWDSSKRRTVRTTAFSHKENEPGAVGRKNAAGTTLRYGRIRSAAADWSRFPLGTQFRISGQRHLYEIDDYGSALVGTDTIDLFKPTLSKMREWGVRHVDIQIVKWGSFERSNSFLERRTQYPHVRAMYHNIQPQLRRERAGKL